MKKLLLVALTAITLLGINGLGMNTALAQDFKQEVKGVKVTAAYPNPTQDMVNFDYAFSNQVEKAEIQFFNLIGEVVLRKELQPSTSHARVSVAELKKGVYFYRLVVNSKERGDIQKLIIQ